MPIDLIADRETDELRTVMAPNVSGQRGIGGLVTLLEAERINHLHSRSPGKSEHMVDVRLIRNGKLGPVHGASPQTQILDSQLLKQGDDLGVGRIEKYPVTRFALGRSLADSKLNPRKSEGMMAQGASAWTVTVTDDCARTAPAKKEPAPTKAKIRFIT